MELNEREREKFPPCGYGLLGLCCSACLLGPCRLSPFGGEPVTGLCGDDRDLIVAKNLLYLATGEALRQIRSLKETVLERGKTRRKGKGKQLSEKGAIGLETKILAQKYGLSSSLSTMELARSIAKELRHLLSLFPETSGPLLSSLYPEKVFPPIYGGKFPFGSLTEVLLDSMHDRSASSNVEDILWQCLQISMITILSEELRQDLSDLTEGERFPAKNQRAFDLLKDFPSAPSPVLVILSGEKNSLMVQECEEASQGKSLILSIREIASLPEIGRRLSKQWSLPVTHLSILALISSPWVSWGLGGLTLGFNVVSDPALPIHGSERVEKFLFEELKKKFGHHYILSSSEELQSVLLEFLRVNR